MSRAHFVRRAAVIGAPAFLAILSSVVPSPSSAAIKLSPIGPGGIGTVFEPPVSAVVVGSLRSEGLPVLGRSVELVADVKINVNGVQYAVGAYSWSIVSRPTGSTASLGGSGLRRSLLLDRVGPYRVRLVACPSGCTVGGKTAPSRTFEVTIDATAQAPIDLEPRTPSFAGRETVPAVIPDESTKCQGGGGFVDPQWVTTTFVGGPSQYTLVEGRVDGSQIAGSDNLLNHHSQDWNLHVVPDAPYRKVLNANQNKSKIEIEWETNEVSEVMRPTIGDRVSVFGFHIIDCGHDEDGNGNFNTEIHPPVLWAVHRPRAFPIPSDQVLDLNRDGAANETVGSNVFVGGVVTDVWANAYSGEITSGDQSALHQPSTNGSDDGPAILGPVDIRRAYTFNVYLPKSPQVVAKAWGKTDAKPAPLYFAVKRHPNAPADAPMGPMPTIVPVTEGDVTYLRVTLDLTGYTGKKLAQQIEAGWIYPSPENHGLESWRLSVPSLKVRDDKDVGGGDWNFWLAGNGPGRRWTKIFSCSGCIDDDTTYYAGSSPWQGMSAGGALADAWLFPSEPLRLFSTGFEDDSVEDDGIERMNAFPPKVHGYASSVTTKHYVANYSVARLGAVTPSLTSAARALHDDYVLTGNGIVAPPPDVVAIFAAAPIEEEDEDEGGGIALLGGAMPAETQTSIAKAPLSEVDASLVRLRAKIDARLAANPAARTRLLAGLAPVRDVVPTAAWNARFGDLLPKP